jgi:hypothetical protein
MIKDIVNTLMVESIEFRLKNDKLMGMIGPISYAREYKTVGLIVHRQTGKSTFIKNFAESIVTGYIIVVPNVRLKELYKGLNVYSVDELDRLGERVDNRPFYVLIDEVSDDQMQYVYFNTQSSSPLQTYIWLRT